MCFWGVVPLVRLIDLQIAEHYRYVESPIPSSIRNVEVQAPRGYVYDRNGEALAMSVEVETVVVNPAGSPILLSLPNLLAAVLEMDAAPLLDKIKQAIDNKRGFLYVKRKIRTRSRRSCAAMDSIGSSFAAKARASIRRSSARPTSSAASIMRSAATTASSYRSTKC